MCPFHGISLHTNFGVDFLNCRVFVEMGGFPGYHISWNTLLPMLLKYFLISIGWRMAEYLEYYIKKNWVGNYLVTKSII